jgi:hypothetical protein
MLDQQITILDGDFFLIDSDKTGPKIVKFFQTAPTWYQHLWRKIRGTQEQVLYYHVGQFIEVDNKVRIVEQQGRVMLRDESHTNKVLNTSNRLCIIRMRHITDKQRFNLKKRALEDLGEGYDIVNCIGKFLTWLTGLKFFARYVEWPQQEICINRVAKWYRDVIGEKFGAKAHSELTTHTMYKYVKANPEKFEIIFEGVPNAN